MNGFCEKVMSVGGGPLRASDIEVLQVNLGLRCNQECVHCHVSASPMRTEAMDWRTMKDVLDAARLARPALVDLTGGAPELNPHFMEFVKALREEGHAVQVRTNLTVMTEPGLEGMPGFLRENGVLLVASMPCYLSENVCAQRGAGSYDKSVQVLRTLNSLGYGREDGLQLNLVYNPGGAFLPPGQPGLEADYRRELYARSGTVFSQLFTITNMPIGRNLTLMRRDDRDGEYMELLRGAFNPATLDGLMCRHQVSVGWDGRLYDCDFNLALGLPVEAAPGHVRQFDPERLARRRVVTGEHCFGCTAGCGSSCRGALAGMAQV